MWKYDLTNTICKFIDPHQILPLMEFISNRNLYSNDSINRSYVRFLRETKMVDFTLNYHEQLSEFTDEISEEYSRQRSQVVSELNEMQEKCRPALEIFTQATMRDMAQERDPQLFINKLEEDHGFQKEMLDHLFVHSKLLYETGNYHKANQLLQIVSNLLPAADERHRNALWGLVACSILEADWDSSWEELTKLKEYIDSHPYDSPLEQVRARTCFLHWALFVFFNHEKGKDTLVDWFLQSNNHSNLNALQTLAPHLLRYLSVCVVISERRNRNMLRDLVKQIQLLAYQYSDPITEFLHCLYVKFDFFGAQEKLRSCEAILSNDFFLTACSNSFMEHARKLIFEAFCRLHNCLSTDMLAQKLDMTKEEAECWIVNLIRRARMDAKIDSQLDHVIMGFSTVSAHQQVVEKTKNVSFACQKMVINLEKRLGLRSGDVFVQD